MTKRKLFTNFTIAKEEAERRGEEIYKLSEHVWFVGKYEQARKAIGSRKAMTLERISNKMKLKRVY